MITHTKVAFKTSDALVQKLVDAAETKLLVNLKDFG